MSSCPLPRNRRCRRRAQRWGSHESRRRALHTCGSRSSTQVLRTNTFRRTSPREFMSEVDEEMCEVIDCERQIYCKGLCEPHYRRKRRTGSVAADRAVGQHSKGGECMADGCERAATER